MSVKSERIAALAHRELLKAMGKHGPMASPHEGWAVIKEELDELWEHVRADTATEQDAAREALHIAAMAMRYAHDLTPVIPL